MSRSIGDVYLKKPEFIRDPIFQQFGNPIPLKRPVITAEPSILMRELRPQDLFLIFASDGLWEQLSDQAAVEIVSRNPRAVSLQILLASSANLQVLSVHFTISNFSVFQFLSICSFIQSFAGYCKEIGKSCHSRGC